MTDKSTRSQTATGAPSPAKAGADAVASAAATIPAEAGSPRDPWALARQDRDAEARDLETRSTEMRDYKPPQLLPDPLPRKGWRFKWVRTAMAGNADNQNVSMKMREGWEPVLAADLPELNLTMDVDSRWAKEGNIEIGGLMLCKIPEEVARRRDEYFAGRAKDHEVAVDRQFKKNSDARMPLEVIERKSTTVFGRQDKGSTDDP